MAGPTAVSPTELNPEWDVTFTDGTDSVGFVLVDGQGNPNPRAIQRTQIQRSAIITSQGSTQFDNLDWPHRTIPQSDWSGGRGMEVFDDDASRYYDGNVIDTSLSGKAILGPLPATGTISYSGGGTSTPGIFFDYKGGKYFVTSPLDGSGSSLYINGDRGAADPNTGALDTLVDATKSWTPNQWQNAYVKITAGPGVEEEQNWRQIASNTPTALTVSSDWKVEHTTSTEYVIVKTNIWNSVVSLADRVTDVAVAGEIVYFAYEGDGSPYYLQRYQSYNNAGAWTERLANESSSFWADKIVATNDGEGKHILWGAINTGKTGGEESGANFRQVWKANVPPQWGSLHVDRGIVFPTDGPWDGRVITNVSNLISTDKNTRFVTNGSFTTGLIGVVDLDEPVDITEYNNLGCLLYASSSKNVNEMELRFDDVADLGGNKQPLKVLGTKEYNPISMIHYDGTLDAQGNPESGDYYNLNTARDGSSAANIIASWTSAMTVYVGYSTPFHSMYIDMGSTVNAVSADLTVKYYDGNSWNSITVSDGTENGTATLGQDGTVQFGTAWRSDWQPFIINSVEAYWVALSVDATLTANITIADVKVMPYPADIIIPAGDGYMDGTIDSQTEVSMQALTGILVGSDAPFNGVIWDLGSTVNAVAGTMAAYYFNGTSWTSLSLTDGTLTGGTTTLGQDGSMTFTIPYNWQPNTMGGTEAYWLWLKPSANLTRNILVYSISVTRQNNSTKGTTAISAGWNWTTLTSLGAVKIPYPDHTQVRSVGLYTNVSAASHTFVMADGWRGINTSPDYYSVPTTSRINRLIPYGSSSGAGINPYIIAEDGIYEIQQENGDAIVKLPITELASLSSEDNGYAVCTNDVYLYFNLGRKIERYYNGTLEDVGPDLDAGLPSGRQGRITELVSYPGRIYASIDAALTSATEYSSILLRAGGGWHEMYRSAANESIYAMGYQSIPGSGTGRLWFAEGDEMKWIPVSTNPDTDADYEFASTGHLITGWIYGGMRTIKKVFDSLTIILENTTVASEYISAEYQVDEDAAWTAITGNFDQIVEEINLASTRPTGRRVRFRLTFNTAKTGVTPVLLASTVDLYGIVPVKYQYTFTGRLAELSNATKPAVNLDGQDERALGYADAAETSLAKLDSWTDNATVLTMNSRYSVYDSKTVLLTAPAHVPVSINSGVQEERHILNITAHDL